MPTSCRVLGLLPLSPGPRRRLSLRPYSRTPSAACAALLGVPLSCNAALRTQLQPGSGTGCLRMRWSFMSLTGRALRPSLMRRCGRLPSLRLPRPRGASNNGTMLCKTNMHRLRRWVRRTVGPAPGPLADTPVHPVDIVAAEHEKWGAQWATPAPHTPDETRAWCARLGPPTDPWAAGLLRPAPAAVLACLRASAPTCSRP